MNDNAGDFTEFEGDFSLASMDGDDNDGFIPSAVVVEVVLYLLKLIAVGE